MSEISELFARDPLGLTINWGEVNTADIFAMDPLKLAECQTAAQKEGRMGPTDRLIARYREARAQFNLGEKSAGATKKVKAEAGPKIAKLDLDDLLNS